MYCNETSTCNVLASLYIKDGVATMTPPTDLLSLESSIVDI